MTRDPLRRAETAGCFLQNKTEDDSVGGRDYEGLKSHLGAWCVLKDALPPSSDFSPL